MNRALSSFLLTVGIFALGALVLWLGFYHDAVLLALIGVAIFLLFWNAIYVGPGDSL
jgi:hypothetical protein